MVLALLAFTGTAFAANSMSFSMASAGDIQMTPEIQVVQPDSATSSMVHFSSSPLFIPANLLD